MIVVLGKIRHETQAKMVQINNLVAESSEALQKVLGSKDETFFYVGYSDIKLTTSSQSNQHKFTIKNRVFPLKPWMLRDKIKEKLLKDFSVEKYGIRPGHVFYTSQLIIFNERNANELIAMLRTVKGETEIDIVNDFNFKNELENNLISRV